MRIVLAVIIIAGFLPLATYGQCNGTKAVIYSGDGFIQSPNYPDECGNAANCTWEFALSSDGQEYMLVLTVVQMRTYYVVDEKKVCSGFIKVKWNQDEIDCATCVDSRNNSEFYSAYYSSNKCDTRIQTGKTAQLTSFPVIVTYKSDGKVLQNHSGPVDGFKMNYSYVQCPSDGETTTSCNIESILSQQQIIIIASSGGGGIILFIVVIIVCSCKRKNKSSDDSVELNGIDGSTNLVVMTETDKPDNDVANGVHQSWTRIAKTPSQSPIDNPSNSILYSTVDETPLQNNQSVEPLYSTVPDDQGVQSKCGSKVDDQSNVEEFSDDESSSVDQPDVLYSTVTTNKNWKKTITYNKTIVSNILYVPAERGDADTVEEAVYDIN